MTKWRGMTAAALAVGAASVPTVGALATEHVPPGDASAAAARVEGILGISETSATVDNEEATASASVVTVGGEPLVDGTAGSQTGEGSSDGALVDTGDTPVGQAQVAPWSATVTEEGSTTEAVAESSVLNLVLLDPAVLEVGVLTSSSTASADEDSSAGSASSDGATVDALDRLHVTVLHSEVDSQNGGSSYVLRLNNSTFLSSDSTNGACQLDLLGLVSLNCLTAGGGTVDGLDTAAAEVAEVTSSSAMVPTVNAFTTTASSGSAPPAETGDPTPEDVDDVDEDVDEDEVDPATEEARVMGTTTSRSAAGGLAATGSPLLAEVATALGLLGLGGCALRAGRRRA